MYKNSRINVQSNGGGSSAQTPILFFHWPFRSLIPYGLPCLRELFRFLVSLINPHEMSGSPNESMIQIALSLLATALETGAEHLVSQKQYSKLVENILQNPFLSSNYWCIWAHKRPDKSMSQRLTIKYSCSVEVRNLWPIIRLCWKKYNGRWKQNFKFLQNVLMLFTDWYWCNFLKVEIYCTALY